ncbi:MAG: Bacterial nucleoid protein Hbs [Gammaproteobacteria bacterium]|jgi:DNA-binding protein HU-beta|nr:Bacterial nucleoid protein Hbs [Gammaproteobacteria bacterium]
MNKSQLISHIAKQSELSLTKAEKVLAAMLNGIETTLTQGGSVSLVGFGNFGTKERAAREVRNPRTGEKMKIKSTVVPYFKAGKFLKEQVDLKK